VAVAVDHLLSEHGRLAVLRAVLGRMLRRDRSRALVLPVGLSDHLLRDIGLLPDQDR
jgi:uncharacterized protein YjiS (DUF1127 family)